MPHLRAYVDCHPNFGRGIKRVVAALKQYVPLGVEIVEVRDAADLIVHHVIGVQNFAEVPLDELIDGDQAAGRDHAIVQYCLRTTEQPQVAWWLPLWNRARAVWSYYDLRGAVATDLGEPDGTRPDLIPHFLRLPLGADPGVFHPFGRPDRSRFGLVTSGYVAATETVGECAEACRRAGVKMAHLGPQLPELERYIADGIVQCFEGISDRDVAHLYRESWYVAALRRVEGFELPAVEGLLCGARPIAFGEEHYTHWFDTSAYYVPETDNRESLTDTIAQIVRCPARPVGGVEHGLAQRTFSWPRVCGQFWRQIIEGA